MSWERKVDALVQEAIRLGKKGRLAERVSHVSETKFWLAEKRCAALPKLLTEGITSSGEPLGSEIY